HSGGLTDASRPGHCQQQVEAGQIGDKSRPGHNQAYGVAIDPRLPRTNACHATRTGGQRSVSQARMMLLKATGASYWIRCPAPGTSTYAAPVISSESRRP